MSLLPQYRFRLFVAGDTENSAQAVANLAAICQEHFGAPCETEIVDILEEPGRALEDKILMTPTLVRLYPTPEQRIVGNLSRPHVVLRILGPGAGAA